MKVGKLSLVTAALALAATATSLAAGEKIKVVETDLWGIGGNGGPFGVTPIGFGTAPIGLGLYGAGPGNFVTFCVETDEFLSEGGEYYIQFSDEARAGGSGGPDPDPLDDKTRYLYAHFIKGTIGAELAAWVGDGGSGGTFTYGTFTSGEDLQRAIWYIEQESGGANNYLAQLAAWAVGGGTGASFSGMSNVRVMNMWANADFTGNRQDLLVMIPLPTPVWMAGIGLCGVVGFCIRRRSVRRDSLEPLEL